MSLGKGGGNPPEMTIARLRTINSAPSVAINDGRPIFRVIPALNKPTKRAANKPAAIARPTGMPVGKSITITIGDRAKTEPMDKSNSPAIINTVTPIASSAISGIGCKTIMKLLSVINRSEMRLKTRVMIASIANALTSGLVIRFFKANRIFCPFFCCFATIRD